MFLDRVPVIDVVDLQTHFSSATFLKVQTTDDVWNAFITCWVSVYIGFPDRIRVDNGSQFTSQKWIELAKKVGVKIVTSAVEIHNSLGAGERYHHPLRRIFNKIRYGEPTIDPHMALKVSVKAIIDTMNSDGLVPSLLVFGVLPLFPPVNATLPIQQERMRSLQIARMEMETIPAEIRLRRALLSNLPAASSIPLYSDQEDLVYRGDEKPFKWAGPFHITRLEDKQVYNDRNGKEVQQSITQVKPFHRDVFLKNIHDSIRSFVKPSKQYLNAFIT